MLSFRNLRFAAAGSIVVGFAFLVGLTTATLCQTKPPSDETTNVIILVKEADSGQPVSQAHLTLQFTEPVLIGRGKKITYNAKSDTEGRYKFSGINKGTITLSVTAADHQAWGKELQLDKDDQVFEVKLKKPQPLI